MRAFIKTLSVATVLYVLLGFGLAFRLEAQTFKTLYSFTSFTNGGPGELILSSPWLYGSLGANLFKLSLDGSFFEALETNGSIGASGLVLADNILYADSPGGGNRAFPVGTVFAVKTDEMGFRTLYNFNGGTDGSIPMGMLILIGDTLYGMTANSLNAPLSGEIFSIKTNGSSPLILHRFSSTSLDNDPALPLWTFTNNDGIAPLSLFFINDVLYGGTTAGGILGGGTLFSLNLDGTGFKVIYSFSRAAPTPIFKVATNDLLYGVTVDPVNNTGSGRNGA